MVFGRLVVQVNMVDIGYRKCQGILEPLVALDAAAAVGTGRALKDRGAVAENTIHRGSRYRIVIGVVNGHGCRGGPDRP